MVAMLLMEAMAAVLVSTAAVPVVLVLTATMAAVTVLRAAELVAMLRIV